MADRMVLKTNVLKAICGSPDRPLKIAEIEIPCYVLEDETRVLSQVGLQSSIGMSKGGNYMAGTHRLSRFISKFCERLPELNVLLARIQNPVEFQPPFGRTAFGYEATILADICEAVLKARDAGLLHPQQIHIAEQCEILMRGFARVGIIALVDEATGYQEVRAREALEEILKKFISTELMKWVKTFPDEFYQQLFRLRDWQYIEFSVKRPGVAGRITNDIVYERLAPGVLEELKRLTPKGSTGKRSHKYFQRLTDDIGHPKLREHLASVITLMRASSNWRNFYSMLNRSLPRWDTTLPMPIDYDEDN